MCENSFQFVYVNQGEFFVCHANVETSLAIAFVMGDDRLFVLVYQPVIITYLCGKREPSNHHRVCAYAALSSMLIYLLSLTYSVNIDEYAQNINSKQIGKCLLNETQSLCFSRSILHCVVFLYQTAKIDFHT